MAAPVRAIAELRQRGVIHPSLPELNAAWQYFMPALMQNAQLAARNGHNYRDASVRIGCGVLGYSHGRFDTDSVGWNNTPRPLTAEEKAEFKPCSEKHAILDCLKRFRLPVGLVMYSDYNQPDDITSLLLEVYVACSNCEEWMSVILPPWFRLMFFRKRLQSDVQCGEPFVRREMSLDQLGLMHQRAHEHKHRHP